MTATEYVVLVDRNDRELGLFEKLAAHQQNRLHRAFSIFIFRQENEGLSVLMQQRALNKYHSAGLWTNACCSHPRANEDIISAGQRRLQEELGFSLPLTRAGSFIYNAHFDNGLSENELDHVLIGLAPLDLTLAANPSEVAATQWLAIPTLQNQLANTPERFTPWLQQALAVAIQALA